MERQGTLDESGVLRDSRDGLLHGSCVLGLLGIQALCQACLPSLQLCHTCLHMRILLSPADQARQRLG